MSEFGGIPESVIDFFSTMEAEVVSEIDDCNILMRYTFNMNKREGDMDLICEPYSITVLLSFQITG